jgi:hypothetical protein
MKIRATFLLVLLITNFFLPAIEIAAQTGDSKQQDIRGFYSTLLERSDNGAAREILGNLFGGESRNAYAELFERSDVLVAAVAAKSGERAQELLDQQIAERNEKPKAMPIIEPPAKPVRPVKKAMPRSKKYGFAPSPDLDWRRSAFGFQPLAAQQGPDIKMTETDQKVHAVGTDKKSFETKDAKGTRTQKAETTHTKDGKVFGMEIKDDQVIEAVSKPDGKSFRQEISLVWGAEVAACPDAKGVSSGTGKAKVMSKTTYTENGTTVTMSSEFDLRAKLTAQVNDQAEMKQYDMQVETYTTNTGYENALERGLIKEIKLKDGRYELHLDIPGNTLEISDGTYGGKRTPAKMGTPVGRKMTDMPEADAKTLGSAIGPMIPSIWNSANEMYKEAQRNWQNYGCVEVTCRVPKTTLETGEQVNVTTETVHLQDGTKINAQLSAEAYPGEVTPESQNGTPATTFTFTSQATEDHSTFMVRSVSKRGIGRGEVEFQVKKEKEENTEAGVWTGTIEAERKQREEREKRSGANLAENGGYAETTTKVRLQLTGMIDRSVDATNAYIANVTGTQELVDFEYDRYKIDEGHCGPNAVPYKGPKEITRTSTTTANYNKETRVYVEIGGRGGTLTFSLPETNGTAVHRYVHKSPCADHDRANTNDAINEDVPTAGGSFSVSFPVDPTQRTVKGTLMVREDDGTTTIYSWELSRREK